MSSQWVDFSALKGSVDIEPVLAHYRVRLKRVRKDYLRGLCPLPTHGSEQSRESFGVDTSRNVWACHLASCCQARNGKVGGNILDMVVYGDLLDSRGGPAAERLERHVEGNRLPDQLASKGGLRGIVWVKKPDFEPATCFPMAPGRGPDRYETPREWHHA
jgi:hypothetical protein